MLHPLAGKHKDPVFLSQSTPTVILDDRFVIRAATPSYLRATGRLAEELIAVNVFDAFPENPDTDEPGSADTLLGCIEQSLARRGGDQVLPLRYDIPDPHHPGEFLVRSWVLVTTPVHDGERTLGVSIRVQDVSPLGDKLATVLGEYGTLLQETDAISATARDAAAELFELLSTMSDYETLTREVTHLRRAMKTRPMIEQAKGILMAQRRCDDKAAFAALRKMSQDNNVPLADVAAAIVYQTIRPV
ncbi:MAG: ANTAR domain-containing protein [Nocardioides sp.]